MNNVYITVGVLGSYYCPNISYNVNTYIGQNFTDYELIFSFDSKQCIPVSSIIDSLNAHNFEIENRIKIFEDHNNNGLIAQVSKIIAEANGQYILFVSIEDAFYDADALCRIASQIQKFPMEANSFRTLVHTDDQWFIYPSDELKQNTAVLCYPADLLKNVLDNIKYCHNNFVELQKEICSSVALLTKINYTDENIIVHLHAEEKKDLPSYYCHFDETKEKLDQLLKEDSLKLNFHELNQSQIEKIRHFLNVKPEEQIRKSIHDEIYRSYRLARESLWGVPDGTLQYIKTLSYICEKSLWKNWLKRASMLFKLNFANRQKKLLFLTYEFSVWPSFQSVYEKALVDSRFVVQLVYVPFYHEYSKVNHEQEIENYRKAGYDIIPCENYNLRNEEPDVVFYIKPYDSIPENFQVNEVRKIVNTIVYIPYGMEIGNTKECLYYQCYSNMQYYADFILAYSPLYYEKMQRYTYTHGKNYLQIGHPRIDLIKDERAIDFSYAQFLLNKSNGRKIILWNTHFTISDGDNWGSFLQYGNTILEYFKVHKDLFLLWRPHPLFYKAVAEYKNMTLEETKSWIRQISSEENIFLDESPSYLTAFKVSDALISDWASFVPEYLAYERPLLATQKPGSSDALLSNAEKGIKTAFSKEEIIAFLDDIYSNKQDYAIHKMVKNCLYMPESGTVAEALLDIIAMPSIPMH